MNAAIQRFRRVSCQRCGKPIWLSASLTKREMKLRESEADLNLGLVSRVFPARRRSCHEEGLHNVDQIIDFPAAKPARAYVF